MDFDNKKFEQISASMDELMPLLNERIAAGQVVKFSPKGISMLPMLRSGRDTVTLSSISRKIKKYDIVLYRRDDGKYVLHRIISLGDTYTLIGDNQFQKEYGIRHGQIIALVVAFTRDERVISTESFLYRFYCVFWNYTRFPRRVFRAIKWRLKKLFNRGNVNE